MPPGCPPTRSSRGRSSRRGSASRYQLATLARHGLKATFFVDPMPALVYGIDRSARDGRGDPGGGAGGAAAPPPQLDRRAIGDRSRRARAVRADRIYPRTSSATLIARRARPAGRGGRAATDRVPRGQLCRQRRYAGARWPRSASPMTAATTASEHPWPSAISLPVAPDRAGRASRADRGAGDGDRGSRRAGCAISSSARCRRPRCAPRSTMPSRDGSCRGDDRQPRLRTRQPRRHARQRGPCPPVRGAVRDAGRARATRCRPRISPTARALAARPRRRAARRPACCGRGWRQAEQLWSNLVEERAA